MDPENLRQICEAISSLGIEAKAAFIVYILVDVGKSILGWIGGAVLIYIAGNTIRKIIGPLFFSVRIAEIVGISDPWMLLDSDKRKIINVIRKGMEK